MSTAVFSARYASEQDKTPLKLEKLEINWANISPEVLSGDMGPVMEDEIRRCHGFVGAVSNLMRSPSSSSKDVIDVSRQLPEKIRDKPQKERVEVLRAELPRTPQSHFLQQTFRLVL